MSCALQTQLISEQMKDMLGQYATMLKIVAGIRRWIVAGGGEMCADCEAILKRLKKLCGRYFGCVPDLSALLN